MTLTAGRLGREEVERVLRRCDLPRLLVADDLQLQRSGPHLAVPCPFHPDTDPSMIVYAPDDRHPGWHLHCYGCGWHGDAIRYWRETRGCDFRAALAALGEDDRPALRVAPRPLPASSWTAIRPAPVAAPPPTPARLSLRRCGEPSRIWSWYDAELQLLLASARYESATGKEVLRWSWCRDAAGRERWYPSPGPKPWPLYGLWRLAEQPATPVLVVEGEKTADAAAAAWPCYAAVTWGGGCGAVQRRPEDHDWSALAGRDLVLVPDLDYEPHKGRRAMLILAHYLTPLAASIKLCDFAGALLPDGWDIADAP